MASDSAPTDPSTDIQAGALRDDPALVSAAHAVRFVSFWTAVLLPFAYVPLVATGTVERYPLAFAGLVVANLVAFVLGHDYRRKRTT